MFSIVNRTAPLPPFKQPVPQGQSKIYSKDTLNLLLGQKQKPQANQPETEE